MVCECCWCEGREDVHFLSCVMAVGEMKVRSGLDRADEKGKDRSMG